MISYKKKISGWGCEKTMYAAGFGNSYDEAVNDAAGNREASNGILHCITPNHCSLILGIRKV